MVRFLAVITSFVLLFAGCKKDDAYQYFFDAPQSVKVKGYKKNITGIAFFQQGDSILFIGDSILHIAHHTAGNEYQYGDTIYAVDNADTIPFRSKFIYLDELNRLYTIGFDQNNVSQFSFSRALNNPDLLQGPAIDNVFGQIHSFCLTDSAKNLYYVLKTGNDYQLKLARQINSQYYNDPNSSVLLASLNDEENIKFPVMEGDRKALLCFSDDHLVYSSRFREEDAFEIVYKTGVVETDVSSLALDPQRNQLFYTIEVDGKYQIQSVSYHEN